MLPPSTSVLSRLWQSLGEVGTATDVHDPRKDGQLVVVLVLDLLHSVAAAERGSDGADCEVYSALLHGNLESRLDACTVAGAIDFQIKSCKETTDVH